MNAPAGVRGVGVDCKPASRMSRGDGNIWIALDRGGHSAALDFQLDADSASAALHFPMATPDVTLAAQGWQVAGNDGVRLLSDTLTFTRERAASQPGDTAQPAQAFP